MKNLKFKKITSLLLCAVMLTGMIVYSAALDLPTFSGTIISENNIDLSGIEVKIYSSNPVYDEEGKLLYYAESYEKSVLTNSDGEFEFVKPTAYCSYTVNAETLPVGYGISKHTQFIVPSRIVDTITASPITAAETALDGDSITVTFSDSNGNILYTDYEIVPDNSAPTATGNMGSMSAGEMILNYSALKALDSYTYSGTVVTNGKNFRYSEEYDLSNFSEIDKADFLYSKGAISEEKKNEFHIEYLNDDTTEHSYCATSLYNQLQTYSIKSQGISKETDNEAVFSLNGTLPNYTDPFDIDISAAEGGPYKFRIFPCSSHIEYSLKETLGRDLKNLYINLITNNSFSAPIMYTNDDGEQYFPIYVIPDEDTSLMSTSSKGLTRLYEGSYLTIVIRQKEALGEKEIIAHEFMHAISHGYTNLFALPDWFSEGLANLSGIVYSGSASVGTIGHIKQYKNNCDKSITYTGSDLKYFSYGSVLYPLYIHTYLGNWATIKQILTNYSLYNNPFLAISSASSVSSYSSAFANMAGYNYDTGKYYSQYNGDEWDHIKERERHLANTFENSVNPMATQYEVYNSSGHDMTLTLQITNGNTSGLIYKKICQSTTGDTVISTVVPSNNRITITNFGDSDCENMILAVVNSVYTNNVISYTITPSLS